MTEPEQQEIDAWFDAVQKDQPTGTIAALIYVRDGQVYLGRGDVSLECKEFPAANASLDAALGDLETAADLIYAACEEAIESVRSRSNAENPA